MNKQKKEKYTRGNQQVDYRREKNMSVIWKREIIYVKQQKEKIILKMRMSKGHLGQHQVCNYSYYRGLRRRTENILEELTPENFPSLRKRHSDGRSRESQIR